MTPSDAIFAFTSSALLFSTLLFQMKILQGGRCFGTAKKRVLLLAVFLLLWAVPYSAPCCMAILFGFGLALGAPPARGASTAVLCVTLLELDTGLWNTVAMLLYDRVLYPWLGMRRQAIMLADNVMSVLMCGAMLLTFWGTGRLILGRLRPESAPGSAAVLILPVTLCLLVKELISGTVYSDTITVDPQLGIVSPRVNNWQMLAIYLAAYGCLIAVLYACRRIADGAEAKTRMALLEQQVRIQESYAREARERWERTRAFRHDLNSHLQVLDGLLKNKKAGEAEAYLEKLEKAAAGLSFSCGTGNAAVDALLESKLARAKQNGILVELAIRLPQNLQIDDMDLCVILGNAVDNAVNGAVAAQGERYIRIDARLKGGFLVLGVENSCAGGTVFREGIGLGNIRAAADKYHGAVQAKMAGGVFRLDVLLIHS